MVEQKNGTLVNFRDDHSGMVSDEMEPGTQYPFEHRGARTVFVEGDNVNYLLISLPTGARKAINLGPRGN